MSAITKVFEIQQKIDKVINDEDLEWYDQGMFTGQSSEEMWRDNSGQYKDAGEEFSFSFSTKGNHEGTIPERAKQAVLQILEGYKK
jgi:hypothetical protein